MIAQEHRPLTIVGNRRSLLEDVDDRKPIFHLQRHEHARHERKVKVHVRFVAFAKVSRRVLRPLISLREQHSVWKSYIDMSAQLTEVVMRLRQILAAGVLPFVKVWDGIETESVNAEAQPKITHLLYRFVNSRVIEIQLRLMRIKAMPIVSFCDRVPRPVRCLEIFKDDPRILEFFRRIAPDIEVFVGKIVVVTVGAYGGARRRSYAARATEPGQSYGTAR